MSSLNSQQAHSMLSSSFNKHDLEIKTGVKPRTVRYYIKLGLVSPPRGKGPGATYSYPHLLLIREVEKHKREKWSPIQQAEFRKSPLHWNGPKMDKNQEKGHTGIKGSVAITRSIRIEWNRAPSSLERRIINLLAKVGREELKLQKGMSKKFSRKWTSE